MLSNIINDLENIYSPVRKVNARVLVYDKQTNTYLTDYTPTDNLKSFTIERTGEESKFFGFAVSQKVNIKLRDVNREINISTDNYLRIDFENGYYIGGNFYVSRVIRDENTNELSITAYDMIKNLTEHYSSEVTALSECLYPQSYISTIANYLGVSWTYINDNTVNDFLDIELPLNYEGSETLRDILDDLAEAMQCIYYMNSNDQITFRRVAINGYVDHIDKSKYITLDSGDNRRLATLYSTTQLGENYSVSLAQTGSTQYIRDNMFYDLRSDVPDLLEHALQAYGGMTVNQFNCSWRGNFGLEPGDRIAITTKDDEIVYAYVFNDSIIYDGSFSMKSSWDYSQEEAEAANTNTLGDRIKETYAFVDKANKQIDMVVSEMDSVEEQVSSIQLTTNTINANVTQIQQNNKEAIDNIYANMDELTQSVNMAITSENIAIEVQKQLSNGVNEVTTSTGFTFDEQGLTISKSDSEIATTITDDGMAIYRNSEKVLTANNQGVDAYNLHATTYLIVGRYSRFEDYGYGRTGCFWIGDSGYTPTDLQTLEEVSDIMILDENEVS